MAVCTTAAACIHTPEGKASQESVKETKQVYIKHKSLSDERAGWGLSDTEAPDPYDSVFVEKVVKSTSKKTEKVKSKKNKEDTSAKYTESDLELLANVVTAESLNQGEGGWILVCDVILNRVRDDSFPDTIPDVIYQNNQFTCTIDGGLQRWPATREVKEICRKELEDGPSYPGVFFYTAGRYSAYGTPLFAYKDHFFSGK